MIDSRTCHACGHTNRPQARFCAGCGTSLDAPADPSSPAANPWPDVDGVRWQRRPGEIAARISPNRLGGDLIVDEGMRAIILRDGAMLDQHGPGRYPLRGGFWERVRSGRRDEDLTILLIDSGEISLEFALTDLWTMDPLRLHANCRIAVQVADSVRFYQNVVKDSPTYTERDLRELIYPELQSAAQAFTAEHSIEQLEQGAAQRNEDFAVDVAERLRQLFAQMGMVFHRVQFFDLRHPRVDELKQVEEDLFLGPVRLEHQRRLFDLYTQAQVLDIAKEEQEAAQFSKRAQIWQNMRRAVLDDRINTRTTDEEWADFVAKTDKEGLLREQELTEFRRRLQWDEEDEVNARKNLVAMANLQSQFDLTAAEHCFAYKLDRQQFARDMEKEEAEARKRHEQLMASLEADMQVAALQRDLAALKQETQHAADAEQRAEATRVLEHELVLARTKADALRESVLADADLAHALRTAEHDLAQKFRQENAALDNTIIRDVHKLEEEIKLGQAETWSKIDDLERESIRKDMELVIEGMSKLKSVQREDREENNKIDRTNMEEMTRINREDAYARQQAAQESQEHSQKLEMARREQEYAQELERQARAQAAEEQTERLAQERLAMEKQYELDRIERMGALSTEALIALSPAAQAAIIAEVKRTEQFKDLSEEQILALAAERNPALAQVLIEKQRVAGEGKLKETEAAMWEKLADERAKAQEAMREQMQAQMDAQAARSAEQNAQIERMANDAAERQARISSEAVRNVTDVAKTVAQRPDNSGTTVVYPPAGAGPTAAGPISTGPVTMGGGGGAPSGGAPSGGGEVQICPNCRVKSPVGEKFCNNCGHQFYRT